MADTKKVALITGGAKGIGRGIGLDLAAQGWSVAFCYRTSVAEAKATAADIAKLGQACLPLWCDVSDPAKAVEVVKQVELAWGRIDALIHCAGPYHRVNLFDETPEGFPVVNPTRCRRCGVCMGACPVRTISFDNYSVEMLTSMIKRVDLVAYQSFQAAKAGTWKVMLLRSR